ncbi:leucine-rich repeat domain-containing protein [Candidatus Poribacteria bacterium]|nr:leucine-rich repeat domain-containing protein [Candidatus Poribacteria bacterium]
MKTLVVNRNLIVSIFAVMLFVYGSQGVSYGQDDAPTATPGETNTSLIVKFQITLDEGVDENAYQIQLRRKTPTGEWIAKCVVIKFGSISEIAGDPGVSASPKSHSGGLFTSGRYSDTTFHIRAIFTNLDPGTTYEARYRDTNVSECTENPPNPDPWSLIGDGATHLVAPPRAEFVDANLAKGVRNALKLATEGGHIDLLKIPKASLAKLTQLNLEDAEITDLTGLEQATQLTELYLSKNQISDITPLAQCTRLTELDLSKNQISDITPLAQCTRLKELHLSENRISDVNPLTGLTSLESLFLLNNPITDTSVLRGLLRAHPELDIFFNRPYIVTQPTRGIDLYWLESDSIRRANLVETHFQDLKDHVQVLNSVTYQRGAQIALDLVNGKMYWTNNRHYYIQRANLDGSDAQKLSINTGNLTGIALDIAEGKIYWTNSGIYSANLDGSNIQKLITVEARSIALDTARGKMYWYNYHKNNIQRANLDGTNIQNVVPTGSLYQIAIDVASGKVYWTTSSNKLQYANLNGTNVQDVVTGVYPESIAIDIAAEKVYWTTNDKIQRANLDGTNVQDVATELNKPHGLALNPSVRFSRHTAVTFSPVQSAAVGEQLELSLKIIGGEAVAGYQATVQFDETALRYVSGANGDYLPAGAFFVEPKVEGNLVKLSAASLAGESNGDGTLATLTFEVIAVKASTLTLSDVLLTNSAGETFVPRIENGEITESTGLKEDVNGDGTVNIADLVLVAGALGETGQNAADVNDDGIVNIADLVLVAGALGTTAAAPALHPQALEMLTATEVKQWLSAAQQLDLTDTTSQRGILFLQQLLTALTPKETALLANYPNPFNPETWIPYHLATDADVTLRIYAVNGTLVRTLSLGHQPAGMYQNRSRAAYWDSKNAFGESVASGVYFYTLTAGDFSATRKMLIRK